MTRLLALAGVIWLLAVMLFAAEPIQVKHEQMLYPVVRVTTKAAGGSGTIIYSEDRGAGCETFILTNHHVIADAIQVKSEWSSLLQRDVKRESNDQVQVEIFRYAEGSTQDISDTCRAEIVAQDPTHDLALLKLQTKRKFEHIARLLPKEVKPAIFEPIWAVGCSLLHPPVVTEGMLNYLDDVIDRKVYWMGSAPIIFGNSGGAVFIEKAGKYHFIGVPSRVAGTYNQVVTHMGWFVPVTRIRQWVADEHLTFLTEAAVKPSECFAKREEMRKRAEMQTLREERARPKDELTPAPPKP